MRVPAPQRPISQSRLSAWAVVPRLDRRLESRKIGIVERRAAKLFEVPFVEPIETHGIEDLPEGLGGQLVIGVAAAAESASSIVIGRHPSRST